MKQFPILILVAYSFSSAFAQNGGGGDAVCKKPSRTVMVTVGNCNKSGMNLPNSSSNPPKAIIEEEKDFDSYKEAYGFGEKGFKVNSSALENKYCDAGKTIHKNGITASCQGTAGGSNGVFGDNEKRGYFRIYDLSCNYKIPCEIPDPAGNLDKRSYYDWIKNHEKQCVDNFNGVKTQVAQTSSAAATIKEEQGCKKPTRTVSVRVGDCNKDGIKLPVMASYMPSPLKQGSKHFNSYEQAMKFANDGYAKDEKSLGEQYCNLSKKAVNNGFTASCKTGTVGSLGVGLEENKQGDYKIYDISCDLTIPCQISEPDGKYVGKEELFRSLEKQEQACKDKFLAKQTSSSSGSQSEDKATQLGR